MSLGRLDQAAEARRMTGREQRLLARQSPETDHPPHSGLPACPERVAFPIISVNYGF